jgi:hypothetical protein
MVKIVSPSSVYSSHPSGKTILYLPFGSENFFIFSSFAYKYSGISKRNKRKINNIFSLIIFHLP